MSRVRQMNRVEIVADLVVVGGGIAGSCAAIAASRLGLRVALVQNRPVLGGNASSEIGLLMAGADRDFKHARETGIVEEIDLANRYHNHEVQWRNSISDATLEDLVTKANVALYLNTHIHAIETADAGAIHAVIGSQQATERIYRFEAPLFVDATGDGCLAVMAGADFMTGTESRDAFDESLAPEKPSKISMGSTLMYRVKDMGRPMKFNKPQWAYSFPKPQDLPVRIRDLDKPQLWIEFGAGLDTIADHMEIRTELLKILYGVWDHVKNHGDYGAENFVLSWVGSVPGKRESRRVVGDYILTQNDVTHPKPMADAVAFGGWPIDVHDPKGFYAKNKWTDYTHLEQLYPIPFRCYYSRNVDNLLLAGRIISATHVAHGSIRLMRTCGVGGQAVGTAAYLCHKYQARPRAIGRDHIHELQQLLLRNDCYIPNVRNEDELDLARRARVTASSQFTDPQTGYRYKAENVISGLSRGIPCKAEKVLSADAGYHHTTEKAPGDSPRGMAGDENLWMSSDMTEDAEPWLQLSWDENQTLSCVQITFDTMVSEQRFFDRLVLGAIATCVSDFVIECPDHNGLWKPIAEVRANFQRHVVVHFEQVQTSRVRIRITGTQGDRHARIYEVRAYAAAPH
ncbi:MAG: FAD-dependent oxidoreductase [Phycisphaeraceae bacterium]|nr:FAD-dependent oxidoreductase [Phycisphaeraceae bacterium]